MTDLVQATDLAEATAKQAHGGFEHGDNDPDATRALQLDRAVVDRLFPPVTPPNRDRAMCAAWDDHRTEPTLRLLR